MVQAPDFSFYLVTDSSMVPATSTFLDQVTKAVENGVTVLQLREKTLLTREFILRAKNVLEITRAHGIPLIINDRVDVALAVDADGVHVGQDDMPAAEVRKLIGPNKIIGVSCASPEETAAVCAEGIATYVGLGTYYPTSTKEVKQVVGPIGINKMLLILHDHSKRNGVDIASVAIGGINHSNVAKVLYQCECFEYKLDGVAVVSCIMAADDATSASKLFVEAMHKLCPWVMESPDAKGVPFPFEQKPLVHHITNNVVKNFSANVTLAIGASPIMSELAEEFPDFAALPTPGSLVINLGTPTPELLKVFLAGLNEYNKMGKPVLLDPVAAGASSARMKACRTLLNSGQFDVIKGNLGEIMAIGELSSSYVPPENDSVTMQGVDSLANRPEKEIARMALHVSANFKCIVVVTGAVNYIADSRRGQVYALNGGSEKMGSVTGTGCALGSVLGAFIACAKYQNKELIDSVILALQSYNYAGEKAASFSAPGTFAASFLDQLLYRELPPNREFSPPSSLAKTSSIRKLY